MTEFLTVEDINSTLLKYGDVPTLHSIDTSKISTSEYEEIMYDFCICSHTISGSTHTFTFNVRNDIWCGGYYIKDSNGDYLDINGTLNDRTITVTTTETSIELVLYLTNLFTTFSFERLSWVSEDLSNINLLMNHMEEPTFTIDMLDGSTATGTVLFTYGEYSATSTITDETVEYNLEDDGTYFNGIVKVTYDGCSYYIRARFVKQVVPILITDTLVASKVNTVNLTIPAGFSGLSTGTVYYDDEEIPVDFVDNNFELDLTEKLDNNDVTVRLSVDETSTVMAHTYEYTIPCIFNQVGSYSDLYLELNALGGSRIIELSEDILLSANIPVTHDVKIIGNNHGINLNEHSLILNEDVTFKVEYVSFNIGNPAIIQGLNTKVEANNCSFTNCQAEDYNNLGSVVLCDIDLESLSVDDDFTTILRNCHFEDNHNCILHGGKLTVDNCTYRNNDLNYVDKNNVAFLHQVDGEATITNNVFDIDYTDDTLCTNQENIGSAQALFKCGIEAQINTASHDYLSSDEKALFCDAPYNNICHLFAKYYYPEINTCVYSSPAAQMENKSLCYMVTDVNWVFKENVQVTRVDADSQNEHRTITWEE